MSYVTYVRSIEKLARAVLDGEVLATPDHPALDGEPSRALRRLVSLDVRRMNGAFFTTSKLRDGPFGNALPNRPSELAALDPSCGAGDLLLRWADRLPAQRSLQATLNSWTPLIHGIDRRTDFVRLARARLVLAAALRSQVTGKTKPLEEQLPNLTVGDGLSRLREGDLPTWVLQNPPFGMSPVPEWFASGSGLVSQAAVFLEAWLMAASAGQRLVAILPDVLRTGSRYRAMRQLISDRSSAISIEPLGQFDADVDIDVFLLSLRRTQGPKPALWWQPQGKRSDVVLTVRVGTVVPHRDPESGPRRRYVSASNLARVRETSIPNETRRYDGPTFRPPFVAIRRTSRPGERPRACATVVTGSLDVMVENHLIVVTPERGGLAACRSIAERLECAEASAWFDQRLGGRHLTTLAIREFLEGTR